MDRVSFTMFHLLTVTMLLLTIPMSILAQHDDHYVGVTRHFVIEARENWYQYAGNGVDDYSEFMKVFFQLVSIDGHPVKATDHLEGDETEFLIQETKKSSLIGPLLFGNVGDTLNVTVRNRCSKTYKDNYRLRKSVGPPLDTDISLHVHLFLYDKASEGSAYQDGTTMWSGEQFDDRIAPGDEWTYQYNLTEGHGPTDDDDDCISGFYHNGHTAEVQFNSGILGPLLACRAGVLDDRGRRRPRPHEFPAFNAPLRHDLFFMLAKFDETMSPYAQFNAVPWNLKMNATLKELIDTNYTKFEEKTSDCRTWMEQWRFSTINAKVGRQEIEVACSCPNNRYGFCDDCLKVHFQAIGVDEDYFALSIQGAQLRSDARGRGRRLSNTLALMPGEFVDGTLVPTPGADEIVIEMIGQPEVDLPTGELPIINTIVIKAENQPSGDLRLIRIDMSEMEWNYTATTGAFPHALVDHSMHQMAPTKVFQSGSSSNAHSHSSMNGTKGAACSAMNYTRTKVDVTVRHDVDTIKHLSDEMFYNLSKEVDAVRVKHKKHLGIFGGEIVLFSGESIFLFLESKLSQKVILKLPSIVTVKNSVDCETGVNTICTIPPSNDMYTGAFIAEVSVAAIDFEPGSPVCHAFTYSAIEDNNKSNRMTDNTMMMGGIYGPLLLCDPARMRKQAHVPRFHLLMGLVDENQSNYAAANAKANKCVGKTLQTPHSINGHLDGRLPDFYTETNRPAQLFFYTLPRALTEVHTMLIYGANFYRQWKDDFSETHAPVAAVNTLLGVPEQVAVNIGASGYYPLVCQVDHHFEGGMRTLLRVYDDPHAVHGTNTGTDDYSMHDGHSGHAGHGMEMDSSTTMMPDMSGHAHHGRKRRQAMNSMEAMAGMMGGMPEHDMMGEEDHAGHDMPEHPGTINTEKTVYRYDDYRRHKHIYIAIDEVSWSYVNGDAANMGTRKQNVTLAGNGYFQKKLKGLNNSNELTFKKLLYREYTSDTFSVRKPTAKSRRHFGYMGPLISGTFGEKIVVVLKNNAELSPLSLRVRLATQQAILKTDEELEKESHRSTTPQTLRTTIIPMMMPDGQMMNHTVVLSDPNAHEYRTEGAESGEIVRYLVTLPFRSCHLEGNGVRRCHVHSEFADACLSSFYTSDHDQMTRALYTGLVGPVLACPPDYDVSERKFFFLTFTNEREAQSLLADKNFPTSMKNNDTMSNGTMSNSTMAMGGMAMGGMAMNASNMTSSNVMNMSAMSGPMGYQESLPAINGRMFWTIDDLDMHRNEQVDWYLLSLGNDLDVHTVHWHGNVFTGWNDDGRRWRGDVVAVGPGESTVVRMNASNPGHWLLHCHISLHQMSGMTVIYRVKNETLPSSASNLHPRDVTSTTGDGGQHGGHHHGNHGSTTASTVCAADAVVINSSNLGIIAPAAAMTTVLVSFLCRSLES